MSMNYPKVIAAVLNSPWMIDPQKLEEIAGLLELKANGLPVTIDDKYLIDPQQAQESLLTKRAASGEDDEPVIIDGIQQINLYGTLSPRMSFFMRFSGGTSTEQFAREINEAADNSKVQTILLAIDSPGGSASGTEEARQAVFRARRKKRVVALARNSFSSGAYYIGSAATTVIATPSTSTPSVGVYGIIQEITQAAEKQGVRFRVFRAGRLKASGNRYEVLTDERATAIQKNVDDIYAMFLASVAENRKLDVGYVEDRFGQGSKMSAAEAAERKIIDRVALVEDVVGEERERARSSQTTSVRVSANEGVTMQVTERIKAALFANGLIANMSESDEVCEKVLRGYLVARGSKAASEDEILAELRAPALVAAGVAPLQTPDGNGSPPKAAPPEDRQKQKAEDQKEERFRISEIRARAMPLGLTEEDIKPLIDDGTSLEEATAKIFEIGEKRNPPVNAIIPGAAQADKFVDGAVAVVMERAGLTDWTTYDGEAFKEHGGSMANLSAMHLARGEMKSSGVRMTGNDEMDAAAYLKYDRPMFFADSGTSNRSSEHPGLLAAIANKALNAGYPMANSTYPRWSRRISNMSDFKPRSFYDVGVFNQLDLVQEREKYKELKFSSEMMAWIKSEKYANFVGLTVEMMKNDDLGGFMAQLSTLTEASEVTLNLTHIMMLAENPLMVDGTAMFDSSRSNIVSGDPNGDVPNATNTSVHRTRHRTTKGFGHETPQNRPPSLWLGPAALEKDAKQTYLTNVYDAKVAQTDANINTVRNEITPVIDANLDTFDAVKWYTLVGLRIPPFIYGYGPFGPSGERKTWYDYSNGARNYSYAGSFGVAPFSPRGIVQNAGTH